MHKIQMMAFVPRTYTSITLLVIGIAFGNIGYANNKALQRLKNLHDTRLITEREAAAFDVGKEYLIRVLDSDESKIFFPQGIAQKFGLTEVELNFFGVLFNRPSAQAPDSPRSVSFYLVASTSSPLSERASSMAESSERWIRKEGLLFNYLKQNSRYDLGKTPLLVLRIIGYPSGKKPYLPKVYQLLRYADLKEFRRRGLALETLETTVKLLPKLGGKYLYVNNIGNRWPAKNEAIPAHLMPEGLQKDILAGIHPEWLNKENAFAEKFLNASGEKLFFISDREAHHAAYCEAMLQRKKSK